VCHKTDSHKIEVCVRNRDMRENQSFAKFLKEKTIFPVGGSADPKAKPKKRNMHTTTYLFMTHGYSFGRKSLYHSMYRRLLRNPILLPRYGMYKNSFCPSPPPSGIVMRRHIARFASTPDPLPEGQVGNPSSCCPLPPITQTKEKVRSKAS